MARIISKVYFPYSIEPYGPVVPYYTLRMMVPTSFSFSIFPLRIISYDTTQGCYRTLSLLYYQL